MRTLTLSRQDYIKLGMRLISEEPVIAQKLLSITYPDPLQTDVSLISGYYKKYCLLSRMPERKGEMYDFRILFISCVLQLFDPSAFSVKNDILWIKRGVVYELSLALNADPAAVSRWVRKSIMAYKIYSEFRDKVKNIMEGIQ